MARRSPREPGESRPSTAEAALTYRPIRFYHAEPLVRTDFRLLLGLAERIEAGTLTTTLLSRHRANPKGVGHSMRYDLWQQNPDFPYKGVYFFEPDEHELHADRPDLVVRDFASSALAEPTSWELRIWDPPEGRGRAELGEFTPGHFDHRDLGRLSVGVKMAIDAMIPPQE